MKIIPAQVTVSAKTSMRDVRALLRSDTTASKISDYKWRSPEEVAFYLQSLRGGQALQTTASFDRKKLTPIYSALVALQSRLDTLAGIDVAIAYDFTKHRNKLAPMLSAVRTELEGKRDKALKTLQKAARKNEPEPLRSLVQKAATFVDKRLGTQCTSRTDYVYATAYAATGLEFNHYIQINSLYSPQVDYTYPEYYIVLTARVDKGETKLYANTLHDFRAPGSFSVGSVVAHKDLEATLATLLTADELVSDTKTKKN